MVVGREGRKKEKRKGGWKEVRRERRKGGG